MSLRFPWRIKKMLSLCSNYSPESFQCEDKLFAYLDDSVSADGTLVCSAGYLFEAAMARKFHNAWKPFLDSMQIEYFHATEHIRRRDAEEIFSKLAQLIKETAIRRL